MNRGDGMRGRRATARRLAVAALLTGLMLVVLANVASADEGSGSGDVGVTATSVLNGFTKEWTGNGVSENGQDCDTTNSDLLTPIPANSKGWLFVLNQVDPDPSGNNAADWDMQATFTPGGTVDGVVVQTNSNTIKWAVYSPLGATLDSAQAFGPVGASAGIFTVSHCADGEVVTTTTAPTTTTTEPATTTTEPATTTTSVSPTTATNETTTTTGGPEVAAEAANTGLPKTGGGLSLPLLFTGIGLMLGGGILLFASRRLTAGSLD